jgi:hypothetical protein
MHSCRRTLLTVAAPCIVGNARMVIDVCVRNPHTGPKLLGSFHAGNRVQLATENVPIHLIDDGVGQWDQLEPLMDCVQT